MKDKSESEDSTETRPDEVKVPGTYPWILLHNMTEELRQYLSSAEYARIDLIIRKRDVKAILALSQDWGLQSINTATSLSTFDLQNSKAKYQLSALLKKYNFDGDKEQRDLCALEKFKRMEEACYRFNHYGIADLRNESCAWIVEAIYHARQFLKKLLGEKLPEFSMLSERSRHGPGATTDTEIGKVSSYFKFEAWPYRCTAAAYRYAKDAIRNDERWLGSLEDEYREVMGIPRHLILDRRTFWQSVLQIVPGARMAFVPKNAETSRTITIEPTMNLYLQLGVDGFIRRRLKRWGINLDDQSKNQDLARIGSLGGEDPFVTLDLVGASDANSLGVCEYLLPDQWNSYLLDLRSPCCELDGDTFWLHKMSAMGNGFTFVLESAIFASVIYGVQMVTNGSYSRDECAVYGDDLVVRRSISERVVGLLSRLGYEVNEEKSFTTGLIRESCGSDWIEGKPVRPVFLSDTPTNVMDLFSAINRIKRTLNTKWGIEESRVCRKMRKWIPENFRDCIGPLSDTDFDSYLHVEVPISARVGPNKDRYEYKRAVFRPSRVRALKLHWRKLMHTLQMDQSEPSFLTERQRRLTGSGSRFTVTLRNQGTVGKKISAASNWQSEYALALTPARDGSR